MKRLFFGLLVAGIATVGSAFTNVTEVHVKRGAETITSAVLAQTNVGSYTQEGGFDTCLNSLITVCRYTVNFPNCIPDKGTYTQTEINSHLSVCWLQLPVIPYARGLTDHNISFGKFPNLS